MILPIDIIDTPIAIKGNIIQEVKAFGLDITFNPAIYQYQMTTKGSLTQNWAQVDGNEIEPGRVRLGGYVGGASGIIGTVDGTLAVVTFKYIANTMVLENFVDDIKNMEQQSTAVVSVGE